MTVELLTAIFLLIICFLAYRLYQFQKTINLILPAIKELASGNLKISYLSHSDNELSNAFAKAVNTISILRQQFDALQTELQRLHAILKGMVDAVIITDIKGNVLLANDAFKRMLAVTDNIEGKHMLTVIRHAQMIEMIQETVLSGDIVSKELTIHNLDDTVRHVSATTVPVHSDTKLIGVVMTLHDITRLKKLEQMRQDFVANVSHEIKTPITAIKGFAETLLDGALADKANAKRFLSLIKSHSDRLNSLVTDLLTLSRIEMGDIKITKSEIDIDELIDYIIITVSEKASAKGLSLSKAVSRPKSKVIADRDRLIQIILNLVDNAIKFTEQGGVTIGFEKIDSSYMLYVKDTGIGIPASHLPRLGERFYRVDKARSRELGGTGLGLAIVKHLVTAHSWRLSFESYVGSGSRVNIIIPEIDIKTDVAE